MVQMIPLSTTALPHPPPPHPPPPHLPSPHLPQSLASGSGAGSAASPGPRRGYGIPCG